MRRRLAGRTGVVTVVLGAMVLALCGTPVEGVRAATLCVNPGGTGGCFSTIQDAINAAASGDTITVAAGTYHEDVTIDRGLTIQGVTGAVIDGSPGSGAPHLTVPSGVIASVSGMTITSTTPIGSGGIANSGMLTLSDCAVNDNHNTPLTGAIGGGIHNTGTLTVTNCTFRGNQARGGGGAIANAGTLTVKTSTVSGNTSFSGGGGIFNDTTGTLTVTDSTLSTNGGGGGGGGIENWGTATVVRSTLAANSAQHGGGIVNTGHLSVTNTTLSGNTTSGAAEQGRGGGIANETGVVTVTAATLSKNTASQGGGIANGSGINSVTLANTIVAGNTASSAPDLFGSITSQTDNLFGTTSGATITLGSGDIVTATPLLGPLSSNGGPTQTIPLLAGSPAIGAGDPSVCASAPVSGVDQRGFPRPSTRCSIGAYEALLTAPTITASANPSTIWPPNHTDVAVTVTVQVTAGGAPLSTPTFVLTNVQVTGGSASDITGFTVGQPSVRGTVQANKDEVYILTYTATDQAGNSAVATVAITVPHDQGQGGGKPQAAPPSRLTGGTTSGAGSRGATLKTVPAPVPTGR